jgi:diaphanous 1
MKTVSIPSMPTVEPAVSAGVSFHFSVLNLLTLTHTKTIVALQVPPSTQTSYSTLRPPSQGYAAGKRSVGRGDLDQAIRSMREGKRRSRPRPLSKIFLDGANAGGRPQSRLFDN